MKATLTAYQSRLHEEALELKQSHGKIEGRVVENLIKIDKEKLFKKLGFSSLFAYAVNCLGYTEQQAYRFISVTRKARQVKPLLNAIKNNDITVSKIQRM